jgi:hypothetical protein
VKPYRVVGLLVMVVGLAAFVWGLYNLMEIGTCASGGPYVSARPCPEGSGKYFAAVPLGIVATLVGGLVGGVGLLLLPIVFTGVGGASVASGVAGEDAGAGAFPFVFGGLFLAFGLLPLLALPALKGRLPSTRSPGSGDATRGRMPFQGRQVTRPAGEPPAAPPPPPASPRSDRPAPLERLEQLERLAALRRSGSITDSEYERLKREVLAQS